MFYTPNKLVWIISIRKRKSLEKAWLCRFDQKISSAVNKRNSKRSHRIGYLFGYKFCIIRLNFEVGHRPALARVGHDSILEVKLRDATHLLQPLFQWTALLLEDFTLIENVIVPQATTFPNFVERFE